MGSKAKLTTEAGIQIDDNRNSLDCPPARRRRAECLAPIHRGDHEGESYVSVVTVRVHAPSQPTR